MKPIYRNLTISMHLMCILLISGNIYAQEAENQAVRPVNIVVEQKVAMNEIEKSSYKLVYFIVELSTEAEARQLAKTFGDREGVLACVVDYGRHLCEVTTRLEVTKMDIVLLCSSLGLKISSYREEIFKVLPPPVIISNDLPDDFPKKERTRDTEQDEINYAKAKAKWIEENPERYKALITKDDADESIKAKKQKEIETR